MGIQAGDITDLVNSTLKDLGRNKITDIATDLTSYVAADKLLQKSKVTFGGGIGYQYNLLNEDDGNARNAGLFAVDNINQVDGTLTGTVPWRHLTTGMAVEKRQMSMNLNTNAQVVNFVKEKRYQRIIAWVKLLEANFWDGPTSSSDTDTPFGLLNYWLDYDASTGFNGGNHTNFSGGPGGVDTGTYTDYKHYTFNFTAVSKTDAVRKMRAAFVKTGFKGIPGTKPISDYKTGNAMGIYTTYDNLYQLEEILESQNDNLGNDIASKDGMTMFRRVPVEYVPYLETNHATSDPIIGINWGCLKTACLSGEWMRETPFAPAPNQHNTLVSHLDTSMNFVCEDRRAGIWLGAKSDPMSD